MSPFTLARFLTLTTLLSSTACASVGPSAARPNHSRSSTRQTGAYSAVPLTASDIERAGAGTAHDAVARLRPTFLSWTRGSTHVARTVYVDGVPVGGVEQLRGIPASVVREIRLLNSFEATARLGTGHSSGAILISTKWGR